MKSLFPEMDKEIREDRKAERREQVQRARDRLRGRDISWVINFLLENGPQTEHNAMIEARDVDNPRQSLDVLIDLLDLWTVRKLWRKPLGRHFGSGELSYLYGIRGVHTQPAEEKE